MIDDEIVEGPCAQPQQNVWVSGLVLGSRGNRTEDGVILHQPLNLSNFRKIGVFGLFYERDSCIPPPQKRRTPLPGAPENTIFGPFFGPILGVFRSRRSNSHTPDEEQDQHSKDITESSTVTTYRHPIIKCPFSCLGYECKLRLIQAPTPLPSSPTTLSCDVLYPYVPLRLSSTPPIPPHTHLYQCVCV